METTIILKDKAVTANGVVIEYRVIESDALPKIGKYFGQILNGDTWEGIDVVRKSSLECATFTRVYINSITDWR